MDIRTQSKILTIAALVLILALVAFYVYTKVITPDPVQTMTVEEIKQPDIVADKLDVSKPVAKEIVKQAGEVVSRPPAVSYTVPADTPKEAVKIVEKQIKQDKVPVELPPADKTIITPTEQKVDVYRINLDKARIGPGAVYFNGKFGAGPTYYNKGLIISGGPTTDGGYYGFIAKTYKF